MTWWRSLQRQFKAWVFTRAVLFGAQELVKLQLGTRLNEAMDKKFGKARADVVQRELATWLRSIAQELSA